MTAATLLRAARKSRRLTQSELAKRADLDQARVSPAERGRDAEFATVQRLLAGAGHRLYAAPTRRDDAATSAAEVRAHLRAGDKRSALRALIQLGDNLAAERGLLRGVLAVTEPEPTGAPVWDAAIAALVSWRLDDKHIPLPEWVTDPRRYLTETRALDVDPADPVPSLSDVPGQFAERGVLVWGDTFRSV
jgi:transcriptional regulator with XRE-family HTH domain